LSKSLAEYHYSFVSQKLTNYFFSLPTVIRLFNSADADTKIKKNPTRVLPLHTPNFFRQVHNHFQSLALDFEDVFSIVKAMDKNQNVQTNLKQTEIWQLKFNCVIFSQPSFFRT